MGLTFDKILVIMVVALFLLGPERLPVYAKKLGEFVRGVKRMANGAKDRLRDEMGPEFDEVNWRQLDPRQYDPRRIIRDALVEDEREARAAERRKRMQEAAARRRAVSNPPTDAAAEEPSVGADDAAGPTEGAEPRSEAVVAGSAEGAAGSTQEAPTKTAVRSGDLIFNFDEEAT